MNRLYLFFLLFFSFACSKSEDHKVIIVQNGLLIEKIFDAEKNLIEQSVINDDSVKNGISIKFYENGDTAVVTKYINGLKDSTEMELYESGELKSLRSWKMGKPWGEYIIYYDGLKDIYFTELDNDTVEVTEPLKEYYSVYGLDGELVYQRKYDEKGNLVSEEGKSILFTKLESFKVMVTDTFSVQVYLATPDWVTREFYMYKYDSDNNLLSKEEQVVNEEYNAIFYQTTFSSHGNYTLKGVSKFIDELSENVKLDTVILDIEVSGTSQI